MHFSCHWHKICNVLRWLMQISKSKRQHDPWLLLLLPSVTVFLSEQPWKSLSFAQGCSDAVREIQHISEGSKYKKICHRNGNYNKSFDCQGEEWITEGIARSILHLCHFRSVHSFKCISRYAFERMNTSKMTQVKNAFERINTSKMTQVKNKSKMTQVKTKVKNKSGRGGRSCPHTPTFYGCRFGQLGCKITQMSDSHSSTVIFASIR